MERHGVIRDELEIKSYILFILGRFEKPLALDALTGIAMEGVGDYFVYINAVEDLARSGFLAESAQSGARLFEITREGRETGGVMETSIPLSVRQRALREIERVKAELERAGAVSADIEPADGMFRVRFSLKAEHGEVLAMDILFPDERQARAAARNFERNAERITTQILGIVTDEPG